MLPKESKSAYELVDGHGPPGQGNVGGGGDSFKIRKMLETPSKL